MIFYEWVIETVDQYDDITETTAYDSYAECLSSFTPTNPDGTINRMVLVRNDWDGDSLEDRSWAYLDNGVLPTHFSGTNGRPDYKVPDKLRKQMKP
jgi:hypothetical protein